MNVWWLGFEYVKARARQAALFQRDRERSLIHKRAARDVDHESARFEEAKTPVVDDAARPIVQV